MAHRQRAAVDSGLYGRLLRRLALALEEADSASRLGQTVPHELELSGLSVAELRLIHAYLDRDLNWLQGWHAAAQELALLQQQAPRVAKSARMGSRTELVARSSHSSSALSSLCCALCAAPVVWLPGLGAQACSACGSQLFRTDPPVR
ncbi:MAG: hypothetical protein CFE49_14255 [Pseudomonas sp. PGPPP3]|nr:MAG: hypothetical protein CFE49_14255 [Pseudomonas sp. PGPPP3]